MNISTEFVQAVQAQDLASAASLIRKGADINVRDKDGNSALHLAAANGDFDMVKLLAGNGADVLARNGQGHTPREAARPAKGDGIVLGDDSFNRMLGIPTPDDLDRKHAGLLGYLAQQERLASAALKEKARALSENTRQTHIQLKNKSDKNRYRLR